MKRRLIIFTSLAFLFSVLSGFFWLYEGKFLIGRASVTQLSFSVDNSYIFITPTQAKGNGQEKVRMTVILLNAQGLGVQGKSVVLETPSELKIEPVQNITDTFGKGIFDISSQKPGDYYVNVSVDNKSLTQKAHLVFN